MVVPDELRHDPTAMQDSDVSVRSREELTLEVALYVVKEAAWPPDEWFRCEEEARLAASLGRGDEIANAVAYVLEVYAELPETPPTHRKITLAGAARIRGLVATVLPPRRYERREPRTVRRARTPRQARAPDRPRPADDGEANDVRATPRRSLSPEGRSAPTRSAASRTVGSQHQARAVSTRRGNAIRSVH
jgi:hypothetical protein